jgi:hypothetical protein
MSQYCTSAVAFSKIHASSLSAGSDQLVLCSSNQGTLLLCTSGVPHLVQACGCATSLMTA